MTTEAGSGRDLVVVPDDRGAQRGVRAISGLRDDEVMTGLQPAAVAVVERFLGSELQHVHFLDLRMSWNPRRDSYGSAILE